MVMVSAVPEVLNGPHTKTRKGGGGYSVIPSRGQGELSSSGLAAFRQVQDHERHPFSSCEYGAGWFLLLLK